MRRINHLKLNYRPGQEMDAKVYLACCPVWSSVSALALINRTQSAPTTTRKKGSAVRRKRSKRTTARPPSRTAQTPPEAQESHIAALRQLIEHLEDHPSALNQLAKAKSSKEIVAFAKKHGFQTSEEALQSVLSEGLNHIRFAPDLSQVSPQKYAEELDKHLETFFFS